jgi:amino acid transporter
MDCNCLTFIFLLLSFYFYLLSSARIIQAKYFNRKDNYFPIQNFPKIFPKISSVVTSPVISPR